MSIDWTIDRTASTVPPRPPAPERRDRSWSRRRVAGVALAGIVALAAALASCGVLVRDVDRAAPAHGRSVRAVDARRPAHPLPIRWGVDRLADPTTMVVDGDDAFVVEPNTVLDVTVADGTVRWVADVKDAEPYLAVHAGTVLVAAVDGFEALDRATGASRWRRTIEDPYDRGRTVGIVATATAAIAVTTTDRGGVVAVDATTGATRWEAAVDGTPHGPMVTDDASGAAIVRMEHGGRVELHVLDAATGAERWSTALGLMTGIPVVDGPRLVVDAGDVDGTGTVTAFDLASGRPVWSAAVDAPSEADEGAVVDGANVVVVDGFGTVTALDRETGRRRWETELASPVFHGRPVVIDHVLVLRDIFGEFQVIDRGSGRLRGQFLATGGFVGVGAGPSGLVAARSGTVHHQVVGLPRAMTTVRAVDPARKAVTIGGAARSSG